MSTRRSRHDLSGSSPSPAHGFRYAASVNAEELCEGFIVKQLELKFKLPAGEDMTSFGPHFKVVTATGYTRCRQPCPRKQQWTLGGLQSTVTLAAGAHRLRDTYSPPCLTVRLGHATFGTPHTYHSGPSLIYPALLPHTS